MVAGEPSGDLYGGKLASGLLRRISSLQIAGMGGDQMAASGVQLIDHYRNVSVVGVFEVLSKLRNLRRAYAALESWIEKNHPDFAVLIDFPDFNFRIARLLKRKGIKTYYFISPQIWAWRKNRIHFLKDHVDLMITVLPFEKRIYEEAGIPVVYVGHPLVEIVHEEVAAQPAYETKFRPQIGLMPGSRDVEVRRHLNPLLNTVERIQRQIKASALLLWPPSLPYDSGSIPSSIEVVRENRYAAMKSCDLLIVASGTATLECAILGVPLFIVYRVGEVSWNLGKVLVNVPYYGLVNWIAQEGVIPEYIQSRMDPELLAADAVSLLTDESRKQQMKDKLSEIVASLGPPGAIDRAVDSILANLNLAVQ